jgi:N,N'-diacetyllegionaminate synthase
MNNNKIEIIAEIANAHQGDPKIAVEIAKEALSFGADAIKFQMYTADDLMVKSHKRYEHFRSQSFAIQDWNFIFDSLFGYQKKVYLDVFGINSFGISLNFPVDGYKIHFSDLTNTPLLIQIAKQGKNIFLGTGGANDFEVNYAISIIKKHSVEKPNIVLLHGFQAYPTLISDTNLSRLEHFKNLFGTEVDYGISDHIAGDNDFATILPILGIPMGIKCIEKHITLDRSAKGTDYYSSVEPVMFQKLVERVRNSELAIGSSPTNFSNSELEYRKTVKKKWLASKDLKSGKILLESDLVLKREDSNTPTLEFDEIVNNRITHNIKADKLIKQSYFKHKVLAIVTITSSLTEGSDLQKLPIIKESSLSYLLKRLSVSLDKGYINRIVLCTSLKEEDDYFVSIANEFKIKSYRCESNNVLDWMIIALNENPEYDIILRAKGENILIDPNYILNSVGYHIDNNLDYTDAISLPRGTGVEVFNTAALKKIFKHAEDLNMGDHLTNYFSDNDFVFKIGSLPVNEKHTKNYNLSLDSIENYKLVNSFCTWLFNNGKYYNYTIDDINEYFSLFPIIKAPKANIIRKNKVHHFSTILKLK